MTNDEKIIKNKVGLLNLAAHLGNVSQACRVMGYSRDSFYRFRELYDEHGEAGLQEISRRKPILKNRVDPAIEEAAVIMAIEQPAFGQVRVSNELKKQGLFVSPGGVRSIWQRHDLETFKKRLKALETKAAQENLVYTKAQLQALERVQEVREATGEIETEHPGYLGSQDTFLCGHDQRRWTHLPADFRGYLHEGRLCQALRSKKRPGGCRFDQRSNPSFF